MGRVFGILLCVAVGAGCNRVYVIATPDGGGLGAAARLKRVEAEIAAERHQREHEQMLRQTWGIETHPAAAGVTEGPVSGDHELGTWDR